MPVYLDRRTQPARWRYRKVVRLHDGRREKISGTPNINTKPAAESAERAHIALAEAGQAARRTVPKAGEFFDGQFWTEHVSTNSPGEQKNKRSIYEYHLEKWIGDVPLDEIRVAPIRAALLDDDGISTKYANNVLAVLSKLLRFAVEEKVIREAPRVKLFRADHPEIPFWDFEEYARIVTAAEVAGPYWLAAVCAAGEAGLRVGEVKALDWKRSIDLVAETVTVHEQERHGIVGPPKGRRRRTVPMTPKLLAALRGLDVVRTGRAVRTAEGLPLTDKRALNGLNAILREAEIPACERPWHRLRHSFATHAALLGINQWVLQAWLGHVSIGMTERYVHVATAHRRPIPAAVAAAGARHADPVQRILGMLGARCNTVATGHPEQAGSRQ
jgi:integrase